MDWMTKNLTKHSNEIKMIPNFQNKNIVTHAMCVTWDTWMSHSIAIRFGTHLVPASQHKHTNTWLYQWRSTFMVAQRTNVRKRCRQNRSLLLRILAFVSCFFFFNLAHIIVQRLQHTHANAVYEARKRKHRRLQTVNVWVCVCCVHECMSAIAQRSSVRRRSGRSSNSTSESLNRIRQFQLGIGNVWIVFCCVKNKHNLHNTHRHRHTRNAFSI